ncbi:ubiquitin-related domain-containing protein [Gigaspora rosea]|uniref:Ubiquitin-related domain-containing protein n=1 Tax=Gigaspora rosea TaxID=44941 RepID=A0A397V4P2_9GLOM|nr:ubiquitin-related domain-containing protein [Gigaspora rosea]
MTLKITLQNCLPHIRYFQISADDIINNVKPYKQILEKHLWTDIKTRLTSQNQPISSSILPPRTNNSLQIFVKTPTDQTLELNVLPSNTVKELKQKIQDRDKCSCYGISFNGKILDDRSRLSDVGLKNGCTCCCYIQILFKAPTGETLELDALPSDTILKLKQKIQARNSSSFSSISCFISISVKSEFGKIFNFQTSPFSTCEDVKQLITNSEIVPPDQQRLFFANKHLEDHRKLSDYNIKHGSTILLTLRLR